MYRWIIVATCLLVTAITFGAGYSFGVFLPFWRESFGWSSTVISGAYSLMLFFFTAMGIFAGWGVDRYGPTKTTMAGGFFLSLGLLLTTQVHFVWQLYFAYVLIGTGMSSAYSPLMTTVSRWFTDRKGLALGIISSGIGVGPLIMAPLAAHIVFNYGWRFCFLVMACAAGLTVAAALFLKKTPEEEGTLNQRAMGNSVIRQSQTRPVESFSEFSDFSLKEALNTKTFWILGSMFLLVGAGIQMVMAHIVACAVDRGIPTITAAAMLSTLTGSSVAGRILMGMLSDRIGRKRTLAISVFAEGVAILGLACASSPWMLFALAATLGFGYGGHGTQLPALTGETLGLSHMGAILGAVTFFWGLGGALGTLLAGYAYDITSSYVSAFIVAAAAMLIVTIMTFRLSRPIRIKT